MNPEDFEEPAMWYCPNEATVFKWSGGYIDVGHMSEVGQFVALDCINVYGLSEKLTLRGFQWACDDYLARLDQEEDPE